MTAFAPIKRRIAAYLRDTSGTAVIETVLILPIMLLSWVALYAFWEGYNSRAAVQKATFVAADMLSREMVPVTNAYLDGLDTVMEYMVQQRFDVSSRFTAYTRTGTADSNVAVVWSYSPSGAMPALTTTALQARAASLPALSTGSTAIIVDTTMGYSPPMGVPFIRYAMPSSFSNTVVLTPRFLAKFCRSGIAC